jgi:CheY-like chemotaxis protein
MAPETIERIFDPYFTTKEKGDGTGLGLAVVRGIVKSHRGAITVDSEIGRGTTFDVFLPCIQSNASHIGERQKSLPCGQERILVVDDEVSLADIAQQMLARLGYDVVQRTSSIEALELFKADPNRFDLVLSDMTMPNMPGDELARRLLLIRSDIPIILSTGYSDRIHKENAAQMGIQDLVMKPLSLETLSQTVRKVLDATRACSPN